MKKWIINKDTKRPVSIGGKVLEFTFEEAEKYIKEHQINGKIVDAPKESSPKTNNGSV